MNKAKLIFIALLAAVLLVGCKGDKKKRPDHEVLQSEMRLSSSDTIEVRSLARQFFALLEQKDLDGAMSMLHYLKDREIQDLPDDLAKKERMVLGTFLGMKYDIDHIIFLKETDSELKYTVTMYEKTDPNDKRNNKVSFLIHPVRRGGEWYLTLADTQTETVKSEIKH